MTLYLTGLALMLAAGVAALVWRTRAGALLFCVLLVGGSVGAMIPAVSVLTGHLLPAMRLTSHIPGGDWVLAIDPLSAFFLITILGVGAANAVYGVGYMAREQESSLRLGTSVSHGTFAVLQVALALVVTAAAIAPFLCAWEVMALSGYVLIIHDHEETGVRRAGLLYLAATHAGTLALFAMFAAWTGTAPDWSFASLRAAAPHLPSGGRVVLALALIGFGFKAGMVPLHFWLPPAHAAAPSHVSGLLSGIVIKVGVYGLLRVAALLGGAPPVWWGWMILALGVASAVLGVLWALTQHDLKRLLAYHSVENIGIIFIGLGIGALGGAYGRPALAALGYAGALMHTANHALFKSLLFLGAGSVDRLTRTRDIERLGGLAKTMPLTWLLFLVGSVAIIGVPPLNGFVSEWTIFQTLFRAGNEPSTLRVAVFAAAALALVGGLALACFAKVCGVVFLGIPRDRRIVVPRDVDATMLGPMVFLGAACVVIGVLPPLLLAPALRASAGMVGMDASESDPLLVEVAHSAARVGLVAAAIIGIGIVTWLFRDVLLRRSALRGGSVRSGETWGCGYTAITPRMQYSASSFAAPLLSAFGGLSAVRTRRDDGHFITIPFDLVLDTLVFPAWTRIRGAAHHLRTIQLGRLHVYLMYIIGTLLVLLAYLGVSVRR
jgi:formate hydrogenlyase subunit 3/multisubunit Na+/H+ antiporter MnhD subunit